MLAKAREAGFGSIRLFFNVTYIDRQLDGSFAWGCYGEMLRGAHVSGLRIEAVLISTDNVPTNPKQVSDFRDFASAAAREFGNIVAAWELWQEPNDLVAFPKDTGRVEIASSSVNSRGSSLVLTPNFS